MDLRDNRKGAVNQVRRALEKGESLTAAAGLLGVSYQALRNWAARGGTRTIPAVADLVDELGMRVPQRRPKVLDSAVD
jgi:hypothetical protein